jgi:hypothetical protein
VSHCFVCKNSRRKQCPIISSISAIVQVGCPRTADKDFAATLQSSNVIHPAWRPCVRFSPFATECIVEYQTVYLQRRKQENNFSVEQTDPMRVKKDSLRGLLKFQFKLTINLLSPFHSGSDAVEVLICGGHCGLR